MPGLKDRRLLEMERHSIREAAKSYGEKEPD
jgi:hypothetical protein